ncbi:MAG: molybdenum cofactor biosynthesis protein MoaE [Hyphomonadaceae bacterium]|nr:MAG: moaE [Caulobacteraceae bacterium]MBT9445197.1 molybdenum cofactor biosynthesis protein MoaE [Hyphomonadaceae bacterium]TPW03572.1 MAG: moaE [Alphaproteobacteria bacterium]
MSEPPATDERAVRIVCEAFDPEGEIAAFRAAHAHAGAIASFTGCVRGGETEALALEHYADLTHRTIAGFVHEARARFDLMGVCIIHRVGRMAPGEAIVLVACASAHRKDALAAVDCLMDRLKTDAPFWKREETGEERRWIEPRAEDVAAARRWNDPASEDGRS